MPPEAPRPKMTLKPTDTSRLKNKTSSSVPKTPPPAPDKPSLPPLPPVQEETPAQQTAMLTDPLTLRDTDASKLKRVKLDSQQPVAASAVSPAVGMGRDKRDTTDTVHLKVIREKRKEVPGVGLVSQTVRLRPATKAPEAAGEQPDAASASVAPTPRPLPEPPPVRPSIKLAVSAGSAAAPAEPATQKPLVPRAAPAEPTEDETSDNKIRTSTIKVRPSAGLKPLPTPGVVLTAPAAPATARPAVPPPDAAEVATPPGPVAIPTEEESSDSKIRTTTVKLRPSAGLKPLPTPGVAFSTTATMAVPPPTAAPTAPPTPAKVTKPMAGHTIKIKTLTPPPAATAPSATVPATSTEQPAATIALQAAPEAPVSGTVKMAAEASAGGHAKKTLKLKAPTPAGEAGISLDQAGTIMPDAAARETAAGTDMLSFAFSAVTTLALIALVGVLVMQAMQAQLFVR